MRNTEAAIHNLIQTYPSSQDGIHPWWQNKLGKKRLIVEPSELLMEWLQQANSVFNKAFSNWPNFMHGSIKNRSHISHAKEHVNQRCLITLDIKSCFDSIKTSMITPVIQQRLGLSRKVCGELVSKLVYKDSLPQGFPTSSFLCNLYLLEPMTTLNNEFKRQGLNFSNYVDDIAISGNLVNSQKKIKPIIQLVSDVLKQHQLEIRKSKIRVMPHHKAQKVCGLTVNRKVNVPKKWSQKVFWHVKNKKINIVRFQGKLAHLRYMDPKRASKMADVADKYGPLPDK